MANASRRASRWGQLLFVAAGLLALGALVSGPGTPAAAQKADKGKAPPIESKVFNDQVVSEVGGLDVLALINEEIEKGWKGNKLTPSDRCSDYEFIRRASLDLIGRIAKVNEIAEFMNDSPSLRRSKLIERLLANQECANHFANIWTNLLLTRSVGDPYHSAMHLWLFEQFLNERQKDGKHIGWNKIVHDLLAAEGRTNDGPANFILAHLGEQIPPGNNQQNWKENGRFDVVPITSRTTRLFLGLRTQCTQCHDHPFNDEWLQSHFWGVNAFFRQVDAPQGRVMAMGGKKKGMMKTQHTLAENPQFNTEGLVPYERRNGLVRYSKAVFLSGEKMPQGAKNRREELAKLITKNDYFAKAFVNRMWGHFFGRSFTKDPDDFGEHSPASHPALLEKLAKEWASSKYKHDPKVMIRWICNSRAYGLTSVANETNDKQDAEPFFSRMLLKAMSPEQLFESLMIATEAKAGKDKEKRADLRAKWLNKLVINFGDDEGSEGTFNGTVVQALLMMNGQEINTAIMDGKDGTVANIMKKFGPALPRSMPAQKAAMTQLYLAALNRPPNERELNHVLSPQVVVMPRLKGRTRDQAFYQAFYQDLFWALLNSNEFILNH